MGRLKLLEALEDEIFTEIVTWHRRSAVSALEDTHLVMLLAGAILTTPWSTKQRFSKALLVNHFFSERSVTVLTFDDGLVPVEEATL